MRILGEEMGPQLSSLLVGTRPKAGNSHPDLKKSTSVL